jgi:hypothetical protein
LEYQLASARSGHTNKNARDILTAAVRAAGVAKNIGTSMIARGKILSISTLEAIDAGSYRR